MSGHEDMRGRRWSNRQRLVVLSFDTPQQAEHFDESAELPLLEGFEIEHVNPASIVELMWACRDVIDKWDDGELIGGDHDLDRLAYKIEELRRALFAARQGAMR